MTTIYVVTGATVEHNDFRGNVRERLVCAYLDEHAAKTRVLELEASNTGAYYAYQPVELKVLGPKKGRTS